MNKLIPLVFYMFSLPYCCSNRSQSETKSPLPGKNGGEKIHFLTEMHNFGKLKAGEIVSFSFVYANKGANQAGIKKIETSCGCITVKYSDLKISPGKESVVEVILNTSGEWGNLLKTLELETTSGEKKILTVSAYIENDNFNNLLKQKR